MARSAHLQSVGRRLHGDKAAQFGPYRIGRQLGIGGMGVVHLAWDQRGRRVALKRLLPGLGPAKRRAYTEMLAEESRVCAALDHTALPRLLDHGEIHGDPYLALEYVEGVSCRRILSEATRQGRRLPAAAALYVVREVLSALDYLHASHAIVHRDVSPSNILVNRHGSIILIDLGITSGVGESGSGADDFKGKPGYMAPEQVAGRRVDSRTDIFSAGAVLSEMLLGCPLFQGSGEL